MNMRIRTLVVAGCLVCAACVPASEASPPAGAFGFVTEPSPASRGEPFTTIDGWTIHIQTLALQVNVSAMPDAEGSGRGYYGSSELYRFDASQPVEVFTRAIPAGRASGRISLMGDYLANTDFEASSDDDERLNVIGLSPVVSARFHARSDAVSNLDGSIYTGPSMLLALRAEKGGRVITLDVTFDISSGFSNESMAAGDVPDDALVTTPVGVVVEALFEDETTQALRFDDFAFADADGDGIVSGIEITLLGCTRCGEESTGRSKRFFETLRARADRILVPR